MKSYQTAGGYAIPNGTTATYFYQVKDWLGSMHITMSSNGTVLNAMDYYSYGKPMPTRNTFATNYEGYRYQFTGHEKDGETSYQYHGARYYDEDLARYMSVDRFATKFFHQSPYVYAGNNPINNVDINGDYSEEVAKGMAERGANNQYTTRVVANPNKEGDYGVSYTRVRKEGTYHKTQYDGKFTGIGKAGLTRKDDFIGNLKARINSPEAQAQGKVTNQMGIDREAAILTDNVAPAGIQSAGTGRASDGRYYKGCMSCHSSAGAYTDDLAREGWHAAGMASFQAGFMFGSMLAPVGGAGIASSEEAMAGGNTITRSESVLGHIFRDAPGHVNPSTATSQGRYINLFENVANNPGNLNQSILAPRAIENGVQGFTQSFRTGQVWTQTRNGKIFDAGVNLISR